MRVGQEQWGSLARNRQGRTQASGFVGGACRSLLKRRDRRISFWLWWCALFSALLAAAQELRKEQ